jgi:hypothetical protein
MGTRDEILVTSGFQRAEYRRPREAAVPRDVNAREIMT